MTDLSDDALAGLLYGLSLSCGAECVDEMDPKLGRCRCTQARETAAALRERGKLWKPRIPDCPFCGENVFDGKHVIGIPGGITCPKQGGGATAKPTDIRIGLPATPAPAGDVTVGAAPDAMQAERKRIASEVRRVCYMVRSVDIPEYDTAKIADRIESGEFARGGK